MPAAAAVPASVKAAAAAASSRLLQPRSRSGWGGVARRRRAQVAPASCSCCFSTASAPAIISHRRAQHYPIDRDNDDRHSEPRALRPPGMRTRRTASSWSSSRSANNSRWSVDPVSGLVESSAPRPQQQRYQAVVGLEIHAQLDVPTKLFSSAPAGSASSSSSSSKANAGLAFFDAAAPGTLPAVSGAAVRAAVLAAAALRSVPRAASRFERKHYAYADLPHGYQITQQRWPLARGGIVEARVAAVTGVEHSAAATAAVSGETTRMKSNKKKKQQQQHTVQCRIDRIQLEMDTGKTTTFTTAPLHQDDNGNRSSTRTVSRVDLNRAGMALIEIVTEPDLRSGAAAAATVKAVRQLLRHCGACRGRMEAGQLRVDCNVNVVEVESGGGSGGGSRSKRIVQKSPRVEIKNLNSLEQVRDAVDYEAARHAELLSSSLHSGEAPNMVEETRTWNVREHRTELLRRKDAAPDYRFLPEPDLPPLVLNERVLNGCGSVDAFVRAHLPELPAAAVERLRQRYGLSESQARALAQDPPAIAFFDEAMRVALSRSTDGDGDSNSPAATKQTSARAMKVANLIGNELLALIKEDQQQQQSALASQATTTTNHDDSVDDENNSYNYSDDTASIRQSKVSAPQLGEIVLLLEENAISTTMAKKLLALLHNAGELRGASPRQVAAQRGLRLVTDAAALRGICEAVVRDHPDLVDVYRRGGKFVAKMQTLLTGKAMAASRGNAHPERLREILCECLQEQAAANK